MCKARYKTSFGVLVEIANDRTGVSMWAKADLPDMHMMDAKGMMIEKMMPQALNATDVIKLIPEIKPMDRGV